MQERYDKERNALIEKMKRNQKNQLNFSQTKRSNKCYKQNS
jgi:hypothetical protein